MKWIVLKGGLVFRLEGFIYIKGLRGYVLERSVCVYMYTRTYTVHT